MRLSQFIPTSANRAQTVQSQPTGVFSFSPIYQRARAQSLALKAVTLARVALENSLIKSTQVKATTYEIPLMIDSDFGTIHCRLDERSSHMEGNSV